MAWYDTLLPPGEGGLSDADRQALVRGGLLQAGLQAYAANMTPGVTPGQALAGGLLGGLGAVNRGAQQLQDSRAKAQDQQFKQAQQQDLVQQMQRRRQIQDLARQFARPDGTFDQAGYRQALYQIDPESAQQLDANDARLKLTSLQTQKAQRDLSVAPTREIDQGLSKLTQEQQPDGTWKTIATASRFAPQQGGGSLFGGDSANSFTPDALQMLSTAAEQGFQLPIPSVGMGGAARVQYVNALADHLKKTGLPLDLSLQTMRFGLTADPAIKQSQKLYSSTKTLEAGADALAQQAMDLSKTVGRGQIPVFNEWVNAGRRATSDTNIARFDRAINAFTHDYAKVVSGALGASAGTDTAIAEAKRQLMASNSPEVFAANIDQMQKEMHVRTDGMLDSIRKQVANLSNRGLPPGTSPAYAPGSGFGTPTAAAVPGPQGMPPAATSGNPPSLQDALNQYGK